MTEVHTATSNRNRVAAEIPEELPGLPKSNPHSLMTSNLSEGGASIDQLPDVTPETTIHSTPHDEV